MPALEPTYDAALASTAIRALFYPRAQDFEPNPAIWDPLKSFLGQLSQSTSPTLQAFTSKTWQKTGYPGWRCEAYLVNEALQVAYLGSIFSQSAEQAARNESIEQLSRIAFELGQEPSLEIETIRNLSPLAITRDYHACRIPTPAEDRSRKTLDQAIKRCLAAYQATAGFSNTLLLKDIKWLSKKVAHRLDQDILRAAKSNE